MFPEILSLLESGAALPVHAHPKSRADTVEGWEEDATSKRWLKVRITAAAEDGKANAALLKFLAKQLKIPKSSLVIVSGESSRYKLVRKRD